MPTVSGDATGTIERFFVHLTARQWEQLVELLADDLVRIGPFGDQLVGKHRYAEFLEGAVPSDYRNDVHLIVTSSDGRSALARVTEHLRYPDGEHHLEEAYAFELSESGLVSRVEVFWQTPDRDPGGLGSASGGSG
jgi:hypothetical protein